MKGPLRLHGYQKAGAKKIRVAMKAGHRRVLFTMPTGSGKTVLTAHMIVQWARAGARVLFLAHTKEIIEQTVRTLEKYGVPPDLISVIMRRHPREDLSLPIQVASIQTLRRRIKLPAADIVVIDEAHHAAAETYLKLIAAYPNAKVLGLTATPYGASGGGLDQAFDELVVGAKPSQLVRSGHMSKARIWTVPREDREGIVRSLQKVRSVGGDFARGKLGRAMNKPKLVGDIVEHWKRIGRGRPTVAYAVTRAHARRIHAAFRRAKIAAEIVDGKTAVDDREAMLSRLRSGETKVIVNCMILVEGWDCPTVKCIVLARPTRSIRLYLQMLGRGLRAGKDLLVLDHSGIAYRHGFPHIDREATIEGLIEGDGEAPCKVCPDCEAVVLAGAGECPECGHTFDLRRELEERHGDLTEVAPAELSTAMARLRKSAIRNGLSSGGAESLLKRVRSEVA